MAQLKKKNPYNSNKSPALKIVLGMFRIRGGSRKCFTKELVLEYLHYTFLSDFF